jgi:hypothetical protein
MKRILIILFTVIGFWSCEKDEIRAVMNEGAGTNVTLSAPTLVLSKDEAENQVLTISWSAPDFGYAAAPSYLLQIDKKGGDFSAGYSTSTGAELKKEFKGSELNAILLNLSLQPDEVHLLDVRVSVVLSSATSLVSPVASLSATPYANVLDLSTPWGVVGSATPNEWNGPDVPFYKTSQNNVFVAYATLKAGEVKFRMNNSWDAPNVNYGGSGGKLVVGGDNIAVTAGTYKITFNLAALTYTLEKYSWGLVGDATTNGWDGPDAQMLEYDPFSDQWRAIVTLKAGEMKFRLNSGWDVNYGGSAGKLVNAGDNIKVTAGTYLVTMNLNDNSYSILPVTKKWGLVGDATPNGWDGPDLPLHLDYSKYSADFDSKGVWYVKGVTMKAGEFKFRANNDWGINYGDTGADGKLDDGGDNIKIAAGVYDIVMDLSGGTPVYTVTKK